MIAVKSKQYSMGSNISVTVKDPRVNFATAEAITRSAENIRRCAVTGEILSGGNRFAHFDYSPELQAILARRYRGAIYAAAASLSPEDPSWLASIQDCKDWYLGIGSNGYGFRLWPPDSVTLRYPESGSLESLAVTLAIALSGERS
jgi:hypothetical protein